MSVLPQRTNGGLTNNDGGILRKGSRIPGPTAPNGAVIGDIWYDTVNKSLKVWNGTSWFAVGTEGTYVNTSRFDEGLELYQPSSTPYIDFHRAANPAGDGGADYNIRLINEANGYLRMYGGTFKAPVLESEGAVYASNWFRSYGNTGWYSETHQGGIWMTDSTWVRVYNGKAFVADNEIKCGGGVGFNARDVAFMGPSGAHGTGWAQFSHWAYRGSDPHYGLMHNGGTVLLSGDTVNLRYQNGDRFFSDLNGSHLAGRLAMRDNSIWTRAWSDDWHVMGWWSGNDGLRITEYGGLYFRVRDQDPVLEILATGTVRARRFDQIGAYDTSALMTYSQGGGTGAKVGFWSAGQNAAQILKCWGSTIEGRSWDDGGWGTINAVLGNQSSLQGKHTVVTAEQRLSKAQRKSKVKKTRAVHFHRKSPEKGWCANCLGSGKLSGHQGKSEKERDALAVGALFGQIFEDICPDCQGDPHSVEPEYHKKQEESGWFGFIAEELAEDFPEAVFWRQPEDGGPPEPSAVDTLALIAILWDEVKDLEDRLTEAEKEK